MNRRQSLATLYSAASAATIFPARLAGSTPLTLDQYDGWRGKRFEATGFFRVEKDAERWWLVTPEGSALVSPVGDIDEFDRLHIRQVRCWAIDDV